MASLIKRRRKKGVAYLIEFVIARRRRSLFLPASYDERAARAITALVSRLCDAIETGRQIDPKDEAWLSAANRELLERFERAGLLVPSERLTLRELFDRYERAEGHKLKERTISSTRYAARVLFSFVDESTQVEDFDKLSARNFVATLARTTYSDATRSLVIGKLRRVFNWGVDVEILEKNPLEGVRRPSGKNKEREFFVDRDAYNKLLDASPSLEWRALFALWRIGGLRRAEAFLVEWRDVDWINGRLFVRSPKTERHKGKDARVIPLFPELREELERLWESLPVGAPSRVVSGVTYNDASNKIRRIIYAAGLPLWSRAVQNLRSSRSIEIYREFGAIAEAEWVGHGVEVAKNHYLHLLDDDYRRAAFPESVGESVGNSVELRAN